MSICVYVEPEDVLDELSDRELVRECKERGLTVEDDSGETRFGQAIDDEWRLERALDRRDWLEVEHLCRKALRAVERSRRANAKPLPFVMPKKTAADATGMTQ